MFLKKINIILGILLLSFLSWAQDSKVDSLKNLLNDAEGKEKLQILFQLSELKINEPQGIEYAKDAVDVAKKIDDKSLADSYNNLGFIYSYQDQGIEALVQLRKSLEISKKANYTSGEFRGLYRIAGTYLYLDSLEKSELISNQLLKMAQEKDSIKHEANALYQLGKIYRKKGNYDTSLVFMNRALAIREKLGKVEDIALTYNGLGQLYFDKADYQKSKDCYLKEIKIKESLNDLYGLAIAYYSFGNTLNYLGDYQPAIEQFQNALRTFEQIKYNEGIAKSCNGIGMVYENLSQSTVAIKDNEENYNKALVYYKRSLDIFRQIGYRSEEGKTMQNIANTYSKLATNQLAAKYGDAWEDSLYKIPTKDLKLIFEKSIDNYNKSLAIFKEANDETQIAIVAINLGSNYSYVRDWGKANQLLSEAIMFARKLNLTYEKVNALFALGESNLLQKNFQVAETNLLECVNLAKELEMKDVVRYSYEKLSKLYEQIGDVQKALNYHKLFVKVKDEIFSEESQKAITEINTKYETVKKDAAAKEQELNIKRLKLTIVGAIIGAFLILLVALLMFKMFREKKEANRVLEEKNELITEQKKEITDSIRYASRIQRAILPSDEMLLQSLPQHFVLYLPRDIVSGDFFWLSQRHGKIVIVAADCTGHGVPGAFMSMLGVSFLYEIVNKEGIMQPASILNFLRDHVKHTLSQTGKKDEAKDGMDISLCVYDPSEMKLEWAGAYNPLYLIRKGELMEYKADKMPIAIHMNDHLPFTNNEIALQKDDTFYISSDGYADQFGGEDGRKFMSKKYKEMLLRIWDKPMDEQKEIILKAHLDWKGGHDQVDDILVVGVRV